MGFGEERMANQQLWPRGGETCKLSHCCSYNFKQFNILGTKMELLTIWWRKVDGDAREGSERREEGDQRLEWWSFQGGDRGWEGHRVWRASEQCAERDNSEKAENRCPVFWNRFWIDPGRVLPTAAPGLEGVLLIPGEVRWNWDTREMNLELDNVRPGWGRRGKAERLCLGFCGRGKTENDRALSKTGTRKNCTVIVGILKEELPKNLQSDLIIIQFSPPDIRYGNAQHIIAFIASYLWQPECWNRQAHKADSR